MVVKGSLPKDQFEVTKKAFGMWIARVQLREVDNEVEFIELSLDHEPTDLDFSKMKEDWVNMNKTLLVNSVVEHDTSSVVNGFYLNDTLAWINKADRVGLVNSINIEKLAGKTETTLFLNGNPFVVSLDSAIQILSSIELYALDCYRRTEEHKIAISNLSTIEDVENYDYTTGYPEKLRFEV